MQDPAFVLVDPFGYSQTPFEVIKRLLGNRRCEVMITFMYQFINRFVSVSNQWNHLDNLYGTTAWREVFETNDPDKRRSILHGVYKSQLETQAGVKYVVPFEMEDSGRRTEYFLFFCTNSLAGLSKMKSAMWSVDPAGDFRYSYSANPNQPRLFTIAPDFLALRQEISNEFRGNDVPVETIEEFVLVNTAFLSTHYKTQVLRPMEREGAIDVITSPRKRALAYPPKTVIRFLTLDR